jgi:hypothetical protein
MDGGRPAGDLRRDAAHESFVQFAPRFCVN